MMPIPHGWPCKCRECLDVKNARVKLRHRSELYGRFLPLKWVDATGTRRRVQAMCMAGWSLAEQAKHLGRDRRHYRHTLRTDHVLALTAKLVAELYPRLIDKTPTSIRANATILWAQRQGFAPASAWDDDTIDDPAAERADRAKAEDVVDETAVRFVCHHKVPMKLTGVDQIEAIRRLAEQNNGYQQIADLLMIDRHQVPRLFRLHGIEPPDVVKEHPHNQGRVWATT